MIKVNEEDIISKQCFMLPPEGEDLFQYSNLTTIPWKSEKHVYNLLIQEKSGFRYWRYGAVKNGFFYHLDFAITVRQEIFVVQLLRDNLSPYEALEFISL